MTAIIVIGPSGAGKSTLVRTIAEVTGIPIAKTVATRPPRLGVIEDDRELISDAEFDRRAANRMFSLVLPYAGYRYGFPVVDDTEQVLIIYKVAGMALIENAYSDMRIIAVQAPIDVLHQRLVQRGTPERFNHDELIDEMKAGRQAAHLIIDTTRPLDECVAMALAIINQS